MKQSTGLFALRNSARLTLAVLAASSFTANATEPLDSITVTANRMPSVNVLAATTVITREDIDRLQITDLPTLLSRQPGIDITTSGGIGKLSSIFMRGTNSSHVLLLVDGVKWYSATTGSSAIQDFPIELIERIEIVRGPRSGLYGAEAIGGVIQIFTRKGQQGMAPFAKVSYGTHNSKQATVGISGGNEQTSYNASFSHQSTDGISALSTDVITNQDEDTYRNNSLSLKLAHQFTEKLAVNLGYVRTEGYNEYDSTYGSVNDDLYSDTTQQIISSTLSLNITDNWEATLSLGESRDKYFNYNNNLSDWDVSTRRRTVSLLNTFELTSEDSLMLGFDYDVDDVDSSTDYEHDSRDNRAVFTSWQGNANKHSWLISIRHDNNEAYGKHNTGNAEWGYWIKDNLQVTVSTGTAFKTPTFNDLYYPFGGGNPKLNHEESKSYGVGLNGLTNNIDWSVNLYQNKVDDLIAGWPTENINKAKIKGIEFDVSTVIADWDVAFNASLLKPEDENTGNILARRAQRLANIHADKQWGAWSTGVSWKLRGHSFDNAANTTRLGGYGLVDLRTAYQLDQDWSVQLSVSNLFDKEYETVNNYNSLDRTAVLSLSYKP